MIISPEPWGDIMLSKHNYAVAFSKLYNEVYFLSGEPNYDRTAVLTGYLDHGIHQVTIGGGRVLRFLRFHVPFIYDIAMRFKRRAIKKVLNEIDLLISFERSGVYPDLNIIKAKRKIWFLADMPEGVSVKRYKGIDEIYSVSKEILGSIEIKKPKHFIHHGCEKVSKIYSPSFQPKEFYYVGNLLIGDVLDTESILEVVKGNPNINFTFIGPYRKEHSNIGGEINPVTLNFIQELKFLENCHLLGAIPSDQLTEKIQKADGFLICYNNLKDKNFGSNSHKAMTYLAMGKPIVSSYMSTYAGLGLMAMVDKKGSEKFKDVFEQTVNHWSEHDNLSLFKKRTRFAEQCTYENHAKRILKHSTYECSEHYRARS